MSTVDQLRDNAIKSAFYDSILQIGLRIISFLLNAIIVRHTSPAIFAVMTVRLHLLYATGLLLSREAFRRAALSNKASILIIKKLINLIWLGFIFSIPLSTMGYMVWYYVMEPPPPEVTQDYSYSVILLSSSIVVEVFAEVPFILTELHLWTTPKVVSEGLMQLSRCFFLALGVHFWPQRAVLVYGISHLVGSFLYVIFFYSYYIYILSNKDQSSKLLVGNFRSLFPSFSFSPHSIKDEIDPELWSVSWSFFKQGWFKEALTEGEFYMMNFFPLISLSQQGIYQVVNNLGSLAARLIFRSVEAASYKFFAQMLQRGVSIKQQSTNQYSKMEDVSRFLKSLLRNLILVSLFIVVFGWSYSRTLLKLYGGDSLSEMGTELLRAQSFYVVFLALNGITEAYTFAAMSNKELEIYNRSLVVFSIIYVTVCLVATRMLGALGFIVANCINMLLRILHSLYYINNHFEGTPHKPLEALVISKPIIFIYLFCWLVTAASEIFVYEISPLLHVLIGGITLLVMIYSLRWELKTPIETIFLNVDSFAQKFNKISVEKGKNKIYSHQIIDKIHKHLYRNGGFTKWL